MSIFINIVAWEDPTLIKTISSAIENADKADDLIFSFALAYKNIPDLSFLDKNKYHLIMFDPDNRPGVWKARQLANEFYNGETYYLQVDSHTSFKQGWDTYYKYQIEDIRAKEQIEKVLISGLHFGERIIDWRWRIQRVGESIGTPSKNDMFTFIIKGKRNATLWKDIEKNYVTLKSLQGGFIFADGSFAEEVKINRLNFHDEELVLSFTAFMKGWLFFCTSKCFMFHETIDYFVHLKENNLFVNDNNKRYSSTKYIDPESRLFSMNTAVLYNDQSVYKVAGAVKTPKEFWDFIDLSDQYDSLHAEFIELLLFLGNPDSL
jgi:hypothetical protein